MLVDKKMEFAPNDIVGMKLLNGEEIVAKITEITDTVYRVSKPIGVALTPNSQIAMVPYMLTASDGETNFEINRAAVVAVVKARAELKNGYIQNTTGLVAASGGDLAGLRTEQAQGESSGGSRPGFKIS